MNRSLQMTYRIGSLAVAQLARIEVVKLLCCELYERRFAQRRLDIQPYILTSAQPVARLNFRFLGREPSIQISAKGLTPLSGRRDAFV